MARTLVHRGPDASGVWTDDGIVLAHRRLSIIDLSASGAQPMSSASSKKIIAYNGEIYNAEDLREALPVRSWRGHSDTEVLLEAVESWGVEGALSRVHGMFAFALWDTEARTLTLARDRAGEKPLYYGWIGESLAFASELKTFRTIPGWAGELDHDAVALFMQHGYVPAPFSIYRDVYKLPPGTWIRFPLATLGQRYEPKTYWSLADTIATAQGERITSVEQATDELDALLRDAIRRQCRSDVPLGVFLSGGIDSSTIVALMQAQLSEPVRTFTIGFTEPTYDESPHARAVAEHLGTRHTELVITPEDAMAVIQDLPSVYDEPFADSSQIPTILVSRLARQSVTVALSGDAGDELFGGYNRHLLAEQIARYTSQLPRAARRLFAHAVGMLSPTQWQRGYGAITPFLPERLRNWPFGDRLHKFSSVLGSEDTEQTYRKLIGQWSAREVCIHSGSVLALPPLDELGLSRTEWMMRADFETYLPSDILVKVDRAAMSVGLETRIPFLDPRVVAFAWRLPLALKVRDGVGKLVLRRVLERYVPRVLFERPKTGFGVPMDSWLRGPLREWAEDMLSPQALRAQGALRPEAVRSKWKEHLAGSRNWQHHVWSALLLQSWLHKQSADGPNPSPLFGTSSSDSTCVS